VEPAAGRAPAWAGGRQGRRAGAAASRRAPRWACTGARRRRRGSPHRRAGDVVEPAAGRAPAWASGRQGRRAGAAASRRATRWAGKGARCRRRAPPYRRAGDVVEPAAGWAPAWAGGRQGRRAGVGVGEKAQRRMSDRVGERASAPRRGRRRWCCAGARGGVPGPRCDRSRDPGTSRRNLIRARKEEFFKVSCLHRFFPLWVRADVDLFSILRMVGHR